MSELFRSAIYKRSQGRIAGRLRFSYWLCCLSSAAGACRFISIPGCWGGPELVFSDAASDAIRFGTAFAVLAVGLWFSFRLVNMPPFADFLIAVEAEMNKVSWPRELSCSELDGGHRVAFCF